MVSFVVSLWDDRTDHIATARQAACQAQGCWEEIRPFPQWGDRGPPRRLVRPGGRSGSRRTDPQEGAAERHRMTRFAIYARVSTDDKGQDPENQLRELRAWCAKEGHTVVREYIDYDSGRKANRKEFMALFRDAQTGSFDAVLFWALA